VATWLVIAIQTRRSIGTRRENYLCSVKAPDHPKRGARSGVSARAGNPVPRTPEGQAGDHSVKGGADAPWRDRARSTLDPAAGEVAAAALRQPTPGFTSKKGTQAGRC
jgi:hypothetical protein